MSIDQALVTPPRRQVDSPPPNANCGHGLRSTRIAVSTLRLDPATCRVGVGGVMSGLVVLLLAVPVDLAFRLGGIDACSGQLVIRFLFGVVRFRVDLPDCAGTRQGGSGAAFGSAPKRAERKARGGRARALAMLRQPAFRRGVFRLLVDLARAAHQRELGLRLRLGVGDPPDTGRLWAIVGPLSAEARNLRNADARIEPEFLDAAFEFEARGRLLLIPVQLVALVVVFALSPPSIRAWRTLRATRA